MPIENGVNWRPLAPEKRGKHQMISEALDMAFKELDPERSEFFDVLINEWESLFPNLPARPGRVVDNMLFLYVRTASARYIVRSKLKMIREVLQKHSGAPKKLAIKMEIHAQ